MHIYQLSASGYFRKVSYMFLPFRIPKFIDLCPTIKSEDYRISLKSTKHERDAVLVFEMYGRFIATSRPVEPKHPVRPHHPKRVQTFWGYIDRTFFHRRGHKENFLVFNEIDQGPSESIQLSAHKLPPYDDASPGKSATKSGQYH